MPKGSKKVAARQAALSRKKKSSKTSVYRAPDAPPETDAAGNGLSAPAPAPMAPSRPGDSLPEFEVPREDVAASLPQAVARTGADASRRATGMRMPYLRADLVRTAKVGAGLVIALIVLAIVL